MVGWVHWVDDYGTVTLTYSLAEISHLDLPTYDDEHRMDFIGAGYAAAVDSNYEPSEREKRMKYFHFYDDVKAYYDYGRVYDEIIQAYYDKNYGDFDDDFIFNLYLVPFFVILNFF